MLPNFVQVNSSSKIGKCDLRTPTLNLRDNFKCITAIQNWIEISVQLRLSVMSNIECWKLSNVSASIATAIFRVNIYWLGVSGSRAKKTPNRYIFTLKMATAMFTETLNNFQHSTRLNPESRSCTLNSSRENLRIRIKRHSWRLHKSRTNVL
jgi:hypothetical protein